MELAQELFLTAVIAVLFSFVVAKLVSVALSTKESVDGSKFRESGGDPVSRGPFVDEVRFFEELRSPPVGRETRVVEAVQEELRTVDRFGDESLVVAEEVVVAEQPKACDEEVGLESDMPPDEPSEITEELSEKEVSREAEVLAGEAVECAVGEIEGRDGEASPEGNKLHDVEVGAVIEAGETADIVVEEEVVDEDDWEGIERSELEKDFAVAARFADDRKDRLEAAMGDDTKMQLYGLHKVATEGPCRDSPPMAMKVSARAKWNAWQKLGNMNPDFAMEQYISLLSESIPNWSDGNSEEMGESDASTMPKQDSPSGAVSDHQIESVFFRELSEATKVKPDDLTNEASLAKQ